MSKIVLEIRNEKMGLSKQVDATEYTPQEMCKTFAVYMKAGYNVYVAEGIETIIERGTKR